jgi:hypothetical protein
MKLFAAAVTFVVPFMVLTGGAFAQSHTLVVRLNVSNSYNNVYVPGVGELLASDLPASGSTYTSPPHFYLASYLNNVLMGIAAKTGSFLNASSNGYSHSLDIEAPFTNSAVFVAFSQGDWKKMDKVAPLIEAGDFLSQVSPSFSFGLGALYPVKIILKYSGINLVSGNVMLRKGYHKITIRNEGTEDGKPKVRIERD